MYKILKKKIKKLNYVGVDFNERLLDKARILNPGVKFYSVKEKHFSQANLFGEIIKYLNENSDSPLQLP